MLKILHRMPSVNEKNNKLQNLRQSYVWRQEISIVNSYYLVNISLSRKACQNHGNNLEVKYFLHSAGQHKIFFPHRKNAHHNNVMRESSQIQQCWLQLLQVSLYLKHARGDFSWQSSHVGATSKRDIFTTGLITYSEWW